MKGTSFAAAALLGCFVACGEGDEGDLTETTSIAEQSVAVAIHTSDQVNNTADSNDKAGTQGFFLYTAVVATDPDLTGLTFNAGFNGPGRMRVDIRDTACAGDNDSTGIVRKTGTVATQAAANPPQYKSQLNNITAGLTTFNCYRISIVLDNAILGFRDAQVVPTQGTAAVSGYLKLVVGQNLALRFGIFGNLDSDADGVLNHKDNCPDVSNPGQEDANNNGVGNACEAPTDSDGDGFPDNTDNCPNTFQLDQANADGDSAGDACDLCANDPGKIAPGNCGCGTAETGDSDGDGTFDCNDGCVNNPFKTAAGTCGCNAFDNDADGDGDVDNCPPVVTCGP